MIRSAWVAAGFAVAISAAAAETSVRDAQIVKTFDGVETWQVRWLEAPQPVCTPPQDDAWYTCPCEGFAFGQRGSASLVRVRAGREIDRLDLGPIFHEPPGTGKAVFPQKPVSADDRNNPDAADLPERIRLRSDVRIIDVADYDHDGSASEFVVQSWSAPCGKREGMLVGVTADNPKLHVFGSVDKPDEPLELPLAVWKQLRQSTGPNVYTSVPCGDHGSQTEHELQTEATPRGIRVREREFDCTDDGTRGALQREEPR